MNVIRSIEGTIYEENKIIGAAEQVSRLKSEDSLFKKICRCGICPVVLLQVIKKQNLELENYFISTAG